MAGPKKILREIHRRSVWQVLGIYLFLAWIVFQVVQTLTEGLGLPTWMPAAALVLLLVGLPVVVATAFVQQGVRTHGPPAARPFSDPAESADTPPEMPPETPVPDPRGAPKLLTWRNAIMAGVFAFAALGLVAAGWVVFGPGILPTSGASEGLAAEDDWDEKTVAVLPFTSVDQENESFRVGIHDALLTQLARVNDLRVISRTSVLVYDGQTEKSIPAIADELAVATVVEGSVQRAENMVQINVQLIDGETDEHLWADSYTRDLSTANLIAIQADIVRDIARELEAALAPGEAAQISAVPTESLEAYDFFLQGNLLYLSVRDEGGLREARRYFERALTLDPEFAQAHANLSIVHSSLFHYGWERTQQGLERARSAADRALELSPGLPEAYRALGWYHYWGYRDYDRALDAFGRAEQGLPGDYYIILGRFAIAKRQGRLEDARTLILRGLELSPNEHLAINDLGTINELERRYEEASRYYGLAIRVNADVALYPLNRDRVAARGAGDTRPLRALLETELRDVESPDVVGAAWSVEFWEGNYDAALEVTRNATLEVVEDQNVFYPVQLLDGLALHWKGDRDAARARFESARSILETRIAAESSDARNHAALGLALAGLGRPDEAVAAGQRAQELMPSDLDIERGQFYVLDLARVYSMIERPADAVAELDRYLAAPGYFGLRGLMLFPSLDALRDEPGFPELEEKWGGGI